MEQHWYVDVIRALFGMLDGIIYGLISTVYELIEEIAHYKVFESIDDFTGRIYALLGIFMLFKVSFSFINYIVNPDSFTDKEKGVQKIIKNIVIMFVMLIICPWFFNTLWQLQANILDENVIGRLVFADLEGNDLASTEFTYDEACGNTKNTAATNGDYIAIMTLRGFYQFYTNDELGFDRTQYETDFNDMKTIVCNVDSPGDLLVAAVYNGDTAGTSANAAWDADYYLVNYRWGISTAVGVVVLLILVGFAMDVGLRVVKLSFLEIIAPIPIVSYIDPASGKNGMFKKWLKEVGSTWASIFIRLLGLFFAISIIQKVGDLQYIGENTKEASAWVELFVIIGALMFAKQLPKLIQNITGINFDGGFSINPLKKVGNQALGGKALLGVGAAGAAAGISALANTGTAIERFRDRNTWRNNQGNLTLGSIASGLGKTLGSPVAGAVSSGYRTYSKVSKDGNIGAGIKSGHLESMFAKQQREDLERKGSTMGGRLRADANRWIGRLNEGQQQVLTAAEQDFWVQGETDRIKQEKYNATHMFTEYSDYIGKINDKIGVDIAVKNAQAYYDEVVSSNDASTEAGSAAIEAAKQQLDRAKLNSYNKLKQENTLVQQYIQSLNQLRSTYSRELGDSQFDFEKEDGAFNIKAKYIASDEATRIGLTHYAAQERAIEEFKNSEEYVSAHDKNSKAAADNASRKVKGPQPEGWTPSANVNAGNATGYGPNEYYAGRGPQHPGDGGHRH